MADDTYTKLFSSITESTVWGEPPTTRCVWVTLLAKADRDGEVHAAVPGLARLANVTLEECERALATFLAPDPYSRTPDHDGRRIEPIDGGWRLINHAKYRGIRHGADTTERKREWDRKHRPSGHARAKARQSDESPTQSDESPTGPTHADAAPAADAGSTASAGLPSPEPLPASEGRSTRKRATSSVEVTDYARVFPGVTARVLEEFALVRRKKRVPLTETAAETIREQAELAGIPLQIAIRTCVERGWAGFRADWYDNQQSNAGVRGNAGAERSDPADGYVDRVNRKLAEGLAAARARGGATADAIDAEFSEVREH